MGMTVSAVISYDTRIDTWCTRQRYQSAVEPEAMSEFQVAPKSVFVTMDAWPEKLYCRWLRYSIAQLQAAESSNQAADRRDSTWQAWRIRPEYAR